jgi:hypothetical protein
MGRRPSSVTSALLATRIRATVAAVETGDIEVVVEALRSSFPEYRRQKAQPFQLCVGQAIEALRAAGSLPIVNEVLMLCHVCVW